MMIKRDRLTRPLLAACTAGMLMLGIAPVSGAGEHRTGASAEEHKHAQHRAGRDHTRGAMGRGMMHGLDLSAEQRREIREIRRANAAENREARAAMRDLQQAIRENIDTGGFDEDQVRILLQTRSDVLVESMLARIRARAAIEQVLTAEQREKMRGARQHRSRR